MTVVVSPYHLTAREPAAMAALLLAERVVTLMPAPVGGPHMGQLLSAAARSTRYRRLVETLRWSEPLWRRGVLAPAIDSASPMADVREVFASIDRDECFAELRPLMRFGLTHDDDACLDAIAADLLKGGPDPGIVVPVSAGLDRFAARRAMCVTRSDGASIAQKAEARLARRLFGLAVPALVQGSAETLLELREVLQEPLEDFRAALDAVVHEIDRVGPSVTDAHLSQWVGELMAASRGYAAAYDEAFPDVAALSDDHDVRPVTATLTITGVVLPVDAVLRSSAAAARATIGKALGGKALDAGAPCGSAGATTLPVRRDPLAEASVLSLVVKVIGGHAGRRG